MLSIKDYIVEALVNTKIYEMADSRQEFYRECKSLYQQIIENTACILYAQENNFSLENIQHWLNELNSYVHKLRRTNLKLSKKRVLLQMLDTVNADDRNILRNDLEKKFSVEHFTMEDFSYQSQGELIYFMYNDFINIVCTSIKDYAGNDPKHDTYQRLATALNIEL